METQQNNFKTISWVMAWICGLLCAVNGGFGGFVGGMIAGWFIGALLYLAAMFLGLAIRCALGAALLGLAVILLGQ